MTLNDEENVYHHRCLRICLNEEKRRNYLMAFDDSESEKECEDIADLLPNDPFEMEFNSVLSSDPFCMDINLSLPKDPFGMDFATVEAWIEDFGIKAYEFESDEAAEGNSNDDNGLEAAEDNSNGESKIFAELNIVWSGSMNYDQEIELIDSSSLVYTEDGSYNDLMCFGSEKYEIEGNVKDDRNDDRKDWENELIDSNSLVYTEDGSYNDLMCCGIEKYDIRGNVKDNRNDDQEDWESELIDSSSLAYTEDDSSNDLMCVGCESYEIEGNVKDDRNGVGAAADDTIIIVLQHLHLGVTNPLGVKNLLSVEMVCKFLRDTVRNDHPNFWAKIQIDYPLSLKITNDNLLTLTDRAQGKLHSLSLVKCLQITNDGLKQVLERNLQLTKLSVVGSTKLSVAGLLQNLKDFNSVASPGIKCLRIGRPIGLTNEHLKEFKLLLGVDEDVNTSNYKPRFYRGGIDLSLDDDRAIDVETCPRCQKLRQVYDCPTEKCRANRQSATPCRACLICIDRCIHCGCCLNDIHYEETFHLEFHCFDCLEKLIQDGVQMASYFFLYS